MDLLIGQAAEQRQQGDAQHDAVMAVIDQTESLVHYVERLQATVRLLADAAARSIERVG
jgi:hypothetical protein